MRKTNLSIVFVVILLFILVMPLSAASWTDRITGGGQASAGATEFSLTVSAWSNTDGASGQVEYWRPDLAFHAKVACLYNGGDRAVVAGPGWNQDGTSYLGEGDWVIVNILEGGTGAGDKVRVYKSTEEEGLYRCDNGPSGGFPGLVYDGNFNIRSK